MNHSEQYRAELHQVLDSIDIAKVRQAIEIFREARDDGRYIFICGNGGSAASASHLVCDIVKGSSYNNPNKFKMMALNDSGPTLTAYANDVGYDSVFLEPLKNFARPGDVVMALSGSGNSPNVIRAIEYANSIGCTTIGLSGRDGGKLAPMSALSIHIPFQNMGRIEDAHMVVCHMICYHFMENDN